MNSDCEKIKEQIADLVTGILPEAQVHELEQHLNECAACRDYARALKDEDMLLTEFFAKIDTNITHQQEHVLQAINHSGVSKQSETHLIRKTIMKTPITKLAAAAVIIIVGLLLLSHFTDSANILPAAFAQVVEAVKKEPWMHTVTTFSKPGESGVWEEWISFESQVEGSIEADGEVIFVDYPKRKAYVYNPTTERIAVHSPLLGDQAAAEGAAGPLEYFKKIMQIDEGAKAKHKKVKHKRTERAEIYETTTLIETPKRKGIRVQVAELKVDLQTHLPVTLKVSLTGHDGQLLYSGSTDFDYLESGPNDIFDFGVPRTAKMVESKTLPAEASDELEQ